MKRAFLQLHIAVFLAGFTGILGRLISLNEGMLVWYRLLITSITLWAIWIFKKNKSVPRRKEIIKIIGVGAIAALHWLSFYGSIKYANVSIALVCFSAIGFFTAVFEPLIFRKRADIYEVLLGLLVMAGIACIFQFDPAYKTGIIVGLISALLGAIFPIFNRKLLEKNSVDGITLFELSGGFIFLSFLMPLYLHFFPVKSFIPGKEDILWLLVLSWVCTVIAFNLSMQALRKISAFTVNLSYNLEPVYGILLAFLLYREDKNLHGGFYLGLFLVVLAVALQMWRLRAIHRRNPQA